MAQTIYDKRTGATPTAFQQKITNPWSRPSAPSSSLGDLVSGWRKADDARMAQIPQQMAGQVPDAGPVQDGTQGVPAQPNIQGGAQVPQMDMSAFQNDQTMQDAGLMPSSPLPVSSPLPKGEAKFEQPVVDAAKNTVSTLIQAKTPDTPMAQASSAQDEAQLHNDIQKIAAAKNPALQWQEIKKQPFYKDNSFYAGLLHTGLAIMSGRKPDEAAAAGEAAMDQADMQNQLRGNRDVLLQQGYSPDSIANAIATGNPKALEMRELSPEDKINYQRENWKMEHDINRQEELQDQLTARANKIADDQTRFNQQKDLLSARFDNSLKTAQAKAQIKNDATQDAKSGGLTPGLDPKEARQWRTSFQTDVNRNRSRTSWIEPGQTLLDNLTAAAASGDDQTAYAALQGGREALTKLFMGGNASMDAKTQQELTGNPNFWQDTIQEAYSKYGNDPSQLAQFLSTQFNLVKNAETSSMKDQAKKHYQSMLEVKGMKPEDALHNVNTLYARPSGVELTPEDVGIGKPAPQRSGALGGVPTVPSFMSQ